MTRIISLIVDGKIDLEFVRKCKEDPDYVYIGRYNSTYNLPSSFWANPFNGRNYSDPKLCLRDYRKHIEAQIEKATDECLREIIGKTLVCWCKPSPCHGDVLIQILKEFGLE